MNKTQNINKVQQQGGSIFTPFWNIIEYANNMSAKDNELNECRRIFHHSIMRINFIFDNNADEYCTTLTDKMKNCIDAKSIEEKFQYYFEKLNKYLEVIINLYLV
jgi:hypothetical protein